MNLKSLLSKFFSKEFILYIFSGVVVTFANWFIYSSLMQMWPENAWRKANIISIVLSIILAYFLNKVFVFQSHQKIFPEIIYFFVSRAIISLIFEHGFMELMISGLRFNPQIEILNYRFPIVKAMASIFVIIGNYTVGKFFIFNKREN